MGSFDTGPSPRRGPQQPTSRSQARLAPPEGTILNRGVLPPASVGEQHIPTRAVGTDQLHLGPADFAYDPAVYAGSVRANDNPEASRWQRVASGNQLLAHLGATDVPLHLSVWGSFSWSNDSGTDGHTRSTFGLYDLASPSVPIIWAANSAYRWLPSDNHMYPIQLFSRLIVPVEDGIDWAVGMLHQFVSGGTHLTQQVRDATLMTLISAYDPDAAANTGVDAPPDV